jgi:hypothetical protein
LLSEVKIDLGFVAIDNNYNEQSDSWEKAGTILAAADLSYESTIHGVNFAANTFRGSAAVTDLGKLGLNIGNLGKLTVEAGGKILTGAGVLIPIADMAFNKNADYWSDGTDAVMGAVAFVPGVGWIISGAYFVANIAVQGATGKSIGQHIGDFVNKPEVQAGIAAWQAIP